MRTWIEIKQISLDYKTQYVYRVLDEDLVNGFFKLNEEEIKEYVENTLLPKAELIKSKSFKNSEPKHGYNTEIWKCTDGFFGKQEWYYYYTKITNE